MFLEARARACIIRMRVLWCSRKRIYYTICYTECLAYLAFASPAYLSLVAAVVAIWCLYGGRMNAPIVKIKTLHSIYSISMFVLSSALVSSLRCEATLMQKTYRAYQVASISLSFNNNNNYSTILRKQQRSAGSSTCNLCRDLEEFTVAPGLSCVSVCSYEQLCVATFRYYSMCIK